MSVEKFWVVVKGMKGGWFLNYLDLNDALAFCKETRPGALIPLLI